VMGRFVPNSWEGDHVLTVLKDITMSLWKEFLTHDGRLVNKWKHYFPAYERHLGKFVNTDITFLEIGCGTGGSLQLWKKYLGPHAKIVGIDINEACATFEEDQIKVRIGDQSDRAFLAKLIDEFGQFEAVLDDGSHMMSHIRAPRTMTSFSLDRRPLRCVGHFCLLICRA
jgi:SAM-dependent methyltransferase